MLLKDLYTINQLTVHPGENKTNLAGNLTINKSHNIFKGHFPDLPILPGVCMIQIIKEMVEGQMNRKLLLKQAGNTKFLSVINPEVNPEINVNVHYAIHEDTIDVEGQLHFGTITFFKIKAEFTNWH